MDVDAVLAELTIPQIQEWRAYDAIEPIGNHWHQTALLAMLIANANRDPEKKPEPYTVEEFLPRNEWADDIDAEEPPTSSPQIGENHANLGGEQEPEWKRWKANMRAYAAATNPQPTPNPPPAPPK